MREGDLLNRSFTGGILLGGEVSPCDPWLTCASASSRVVLHLPESSVLGEPGSSATAPVMSLIVRPTGDGARCWIHLISPSWRTRRLLRLAATRDCCCQPTLPADSGTRRPWGRRRIQGRNVLVEHMLGPCRARPVATLVTDKRVGEPSRSGSGEGRSGGSSGRRDRLLHSGLRLGFHLRRYLVSGSGESAGSRRGRRSTCALASLRGQQTNSQHYPQDHHDDQRVLTVDHRSSLRAINLCS